MESKEMKNFIFLCIMRYARFCALALSFLEKFSFLSEENKRYRFRYLEILKLFLHFNTEKNDVVLNQQQYFN